jgi:hypothetical protein
MPHLDDLDDLLADAPTIVAPRDPRVTPLPEMTRREASWHASLAEKRAEVAHRQGQGNAADEQTRAAEAGAHALAEHAADAGAIAVKGIAFARPSAYSVFAVQNVEKLFAEDALLPLEQDALLMLCFASPLQAYVLSKPPGDKAALRQRAIDLALALDDADTIATVKAWCLEQFALLNGVKKPSSPAPATPAAGAPMPDRSAASPTPSTLPNTPTPAETTPGSAPSSTC